MKLSCPSCRAVVAAGQFNVATDVAVCVGCDEAFLISEQLARGQIADGFDLRKAPRGTWYEDIAGGWRIGSTIRSPLALIVLVPFTVVWAGGSMWGLYGQQIAQGKFNPLLSLFGLPFLVGSLVLCGLVVMCIGGKVEVSVDRDAGRVFMGCGSIGWTRRFAWSGVNSVDDASGKAGLAGSGISLIGQTKITFGGMTESRHEFLLNGLRTLLAERDR